MRHVVAADDWYLTGLTEGRYGRGRIGEASLTFADLLQVADEGAAAWEAVIEVAPDADASLTQTTVPIGTSGRR